MEKNIGQVMLALSMPKHVALTCGGQGARCEAATWLICIHSGVGTDLFDGGTEKARTERATCARFGPAREKTRWDERMATGSW